MLRYFKNVNEVNSYKDNPPHAHQEEENLQVWVRIQEADCLQETEPAHHLVAHKNDPQRGF